MTVSLICAFAVSLVLTAVIGKYLIPELRKLKVSQSIRAEGPTWHNTKQGTPMMGGLMFIAAITVTVLVFGFKDMLRGDIRHILVLVVGLINGAIGFVDDYMKMKKRQNEGLTAIQKFLIQLATAAALILLLRLKGYLTPNLYIPFWNVSVPVWEPLYLFFIAFIMVGCANAVNLTDGIDGLLSGVTLPVAIFYALAAFLWGYATMGVFAAALAGGLVGFLIYNFHPAKVFMGDTGSLFLGGVVCALALVSDMPLILLPVGIIYIIETVSVILQVGYFKLTHGKRIFKMAPIHHHFELCGWNEYKIFTVFTAVSAVFCAIAYIGIRWRMG